jgi:hypothetical protein
VNGRSTLAYILHQPCTKTFVALTQLSKTIGARTVITTKRDFSHWVALLTTKKAGSSQPGTHAHVRRTNAYPPIRLAKGYYQPPGAGDGSSSSDEEEEDEEEDEEEEEMNRDFLPSTSVAIDVPSMRPPSKVADDSLQAAMSRSIDPGPTLDLDPRHGARRVPVEEGADDDDDEANHRAKVAIQPRRGSLHARRILERDVPDRQARGEV